MIGLVKLVKTTGRVTVVVLGKAEVDVIETLLAVEDEEVKVDEIEVATLEVEEGLKVEVVASILITDP